MLFTLKKWLKKACLFSASASLACFFGSPLANAAPPGTAFGREANPSSVSINGYKLEITPKVNLKYNGNAQKLIDAATLTYNGVTVNYGNEPGTPVLYMRVSSSQTAPTDADDWKQINPTSTDKFGAITATNGGTYYIYFYVDSYNSEDYPDSGSDPIPS